MVSMPGELRYVVVEFANLQEIGIVSEEWFVQPPVLLRKGIVHYPDHLSSDRSKFLKALKDHSVPEDNWNEYEVCVRGDDSKYKRLPSRRGCR